MIFDFINFLAYWLHNEDVSNPKTLNNIFQRMNQKLSVEMIDNEESKKKLINNIEEAISFGAFGVPCYYVPKTKK